MKNDPMGSWELHAIDVCNPPVAGNIGIFNDAEGLYIGLRYTSRSMARKGGWSCNQSLQWAPHSASGSCRISP